MVAWGSQMLWTYVPWAYETLDTHFKAVRISISAAVGTVSSYQVVESSFTVVPTPKFQLALNHQILDEDYVQVSFLTSFEMDGNQMNSKYKGAANTMQHTRVII